MAAMSLSTWRPGAAKSAITGFVERVSTEGGDGFVPEQERIAVFDNDGTLWCEKPQYVQLLFAFAAAKERVMQHPELADDDPVYAALQAGDTEKLESFGLEAIAKVI